MCRAKVSRQSSQNSCEEIDKSVHVEKTELKFDQAKELSLALYFFSRLLRKLSFTCY